MKITATAFLNALTRLEQIEEELPVIAEQVATETRAHLLVGVNLNIYSTAPGTYKRTEHLRDGLYVVPDQGAVTLGIRDADYAQIVELGRKDSGGLTLQTDQALALARKGGPPTNPFGRSGVNYRVPGGFVAAAQVFAAYRMQALFVKAVKRRV